MRKLQGVISAYYILKGAPLKHVALFFDDVHVVGLKQLQHVIEDSAGGADLTFLQSRNFLNHISPVGQAPLLTAAQLASYMEDFQPELYSLPMSGLEILNAVSVRMASSELESADSDSAPIFSEMEARFEAHLPAETEQPATSKEDVLSVALDALPAPDETCSWDDIFAFKAELLEKQWGFRRFLGTLATKQQTEAEVRDEIEWMVNEYRKAMEIHHIKASQGLIDIYLITPLELIEDLVKFRWSKIAKGMLSVQKREVELMEAEIKAPGRECAYMFHARKRFGGGAPGAPHDSLDLS
jgi:hypothetical protein